MQDERKQESRGDKDKEKIGTDTVTQIIHYLGQDKLSTPEDDTRKERNDPVIYSNKMQLLSQEIKDKLETLSKIANTMKKN